MPRPRCPGAWSTRSTGELTMDDVLGYKGKHAVVTGAASGMGAATASALIELGANVTAIDMKPTSLAVAAMLEVDLGDRSAIDDAVAAPGDPAAPGFGAPALPGPPFSTSTPWRATSP